MKYLIAIMLAFITLNLTVAFADEEDYRDRITRVREAELERHRSLFISADKMKKMGFEAHGSERVLSKKIGGTKFFLTDEEGRSYHNCEECQKALREKRKGSSK